MKWQTEPMLDFINKRDLPTVLLIDDDMVSREVMATMLTMSGYAVHTAEDGSAALGLLAEKECVPGVILMDAQMPGISGTELIEKLRRRSEARVYVISGSHADQPVQAAADGFLLKPFPPEALTRLLGEQQTQPAAAGLDPAEAVVNRETLAQLLEIMPAGQVRQIFEAILADLGKRVNTLQLAVSSADWEEARRIGHTIKGGAAMAGAIQVARLGEMIESGALEVKRGVNQVDNSAAILQDLRTAQMNLQRILDAEFKQ